MSNEWYKYLGVISMDQVVCASVSGKDKNAVDYDIYECVPEESCGMDGVDADKTTWYVECSEGAAKIFISTVTALVAAAYVM